MILKNRNLKNDILVIAEIGINHNGDFDLCMEMIKQAIKSGADAVKLQSINPKHSYMENTKSFKIFKNKNFYIHQLLKIQKYCQRNKIIFFTTPGDIETLEFLKPLKLDIFKVSSGLFTNTPLIIEILKQKKPIILSTGMATIYEIDYICNLVKKTIGNNFALLKCTASYPCDDSDVNLLGIKSLKKRYDCIIGYSDHTIDDLAVISAINQGATVIEKHFTIDKKIKGGDNSMSMIPKDFKNMVTKIRRIEKMLGSKTLSPTKSEKSERKKRYRFLVSLNSLKKGEYINSKNINMKRIHKFKKEYIPAIDFLKFNKKKLSKNVPKNTILKASFFK